VVSHQDVSLHLALLLLLPRRSKHADKTAYLVVPRPEQRTPLIHATDAHDHRKGIKNSNDVMVEDSSNKLTKLTTNRIMSIRSHKDNMAISTVPNSAT
jgi:hypothetical protein